MCFLICLVIYVDQFCKYYIPIFCIVHSNWFLLDVINNSCIYFYAWLLLVSPMSAILFDTLKAISGFCWVLLSQWEWVKVVTLSYSTKDLILTEAPQFSLNSHTLVCPVLLINGQCSKMFDFKKLFTQSSNLS